MTRFRKRLAVAIAACLCLGAGAAIAATTSNSGIGLSDIQVVTKTSINSTNSTSYVNIASANATITIDENEYIRARFSGESLCGGETNDAATCTMRTFITGGPGALNPKSGTDFVIDSFPADSCCSDPSGLEGRSMEWLTDPLPAGTYTVRAQFAVSDSNISFAVDDWTFSLEEIDVAPPA